MEDHLNDPLEPRKRVSEQLLKLLGSKLTQTKAGFCARWVQLKAAGAGAVSPPKHRAGTRPPFTQLRVHRQSAPWKRRGRRTKLLPKPRVGPRWMLPPSAASSCSVRLVAREHAARCGSPLPSLLSRRTHPRPRSLCCLSHCCWPFFSHPRPTCEGRSQRDVFWVFFCFSTKKLGGLREEHDRGRRKGKEEGQSFRCVSFIIWSRTFKQEMREEEGLIANVLFLLTALASSETFMDIFAHISQFHTENYINIIFTEPLPSAWYCDIGTRTGSSGAQTPPT